MVTMTLDATGVEAREVCAGVVLKPVNLASGETGTVDSKVHPETGTARGLISSSGCQAICDVCNSRPGGGATAGELAKAGKQVPGSARGAGSFVVCIGGMPGKIG